MAELPSNFTFRDLLNLVAANDGRARSVIEKAFEWEHVRRIEAGKWLLAFGAAITLGTFTFLSADDPPSAALVSVLLVLGGCAIAAGFGAFWMASSASRRLARAAVLVARLEEVRPFLTKLRAEGLL